MMRIGEYLVLKEAEVNKKLGENVLDWETFKRNKSIQYPYISIIIMFLGLSFGFSLTGLYISFDYFTGLYRFLHLHNFTEAFWIDFIFHFLFGIFTYIFVKRNIVSIEKVKK
jgi:pilus assembly protein TadC